MRDLIIKHIPDKFMHYISQKPIVKFLQGVLHNSTITNNNSHLCISTMTWNILASGYTSPNVYYYVNPEFLDENHRFNNISYDILSNHCDIICLQEVEKRIFEKLSKMSEGEYKGIFEKRSGLTCDGLSLFYKTSKFSQVYYELINLNKISFNAEKVMTTDSLTKLKRQPMTHNIAQLIVLQPTDAKVRDSIDYFLVVNLHLYWDPSKEMLKFIQIFEILNKVNEIYNKYKSENKKVSVMLTGDFNSLPGSNVLDFIQDKLNAKKIEASELPLYVELNKILKAKYSTEENSLTLHNSHEKNSYLTNIKPDFSGVLDHMFYSNENFYSKSEVSFFDTNKFTTEKALPNSFHGSDHIYLISKFYL